MRNLRTASKLLLAAVACLVPLGAIHCTNITPTGGAADGGSLNLAGYYVSLLPLQPASAWTQNGGTINPVCQPAPNPYETGFSDLKNNGGVDLSTASNQANCCSCAARSRAFPTATTPFAGTKLVGEVLFSRGAGDQYSLASFRVSLKLQGQDVGSKLFQGEGNRNNNCAGSSELPAEIVNGAFEFDLSTIAKNNATAFDEIDVDMNGYGCEDATTDEKLLVLGIATPAGDGGTNPAATNNPTATGTGTGMPAPGPYSVGFFPVLCGPNTTLTAIESGVCPNGVDLSQTPTVECIVEPCSTPSTCLMVAGAVTANGQRAKADCSALAGMCPANYQMTISTRIKCL